MKNVLSLIFAGLLGGLVVVGARELMDKNVNIAPRNHTKFVSENTPIGGVVDLAQAAANATPSVVYIEAQEAQSNSNQRRNDDFFGQFFGFQTGPKKGTGSGVVISADGYIVTNNHVVDFADEVKVTLPAPDNRVMTAKVVGKDPRYDVAVLKINATNLSAIQKGNSDALRIGEWVLAIGYPYDIGTTVTAGIISAKDKKLREDNPMEDFLQTDAVVNPGNSGGALVDGQGRLVGINTAIQTQTGSYVGYSFAIPISIVSKVVEDIKAGKVPPQTKPQAQQGFRGNVGRPKLGIEMVPDQYFEEVARAKDLNITEGVIVDNVLNGSSAQYAGLLPNDVIIKIDDDVIRSTQELKEKVSNAKTGDVLKVVVFRNGKTKEVSVTLRG
ncbi:MAG: trypsin-like peptidase domain-containing protein [Saprospiraceae bacterium]|nr:trypsin-like peptidase domain-containing protein [Saprospiraceae bacterium]